MDASLCWFLLDNFSFGEKLFDTEHGVVGRGASHLLNHGLPQDSSGEEFIIGLKMFFVCVGF